MRVAKVRVFIGIIIFLLVLSMCLAQLHGIDSPSNALPSLAIDLPSERYPKVSEPEFSEEPLPKQESVVVLVKEGDTLWKFANMYGVEVEKIMIENGLTSDSLKIGQKLIIPESASEANVCESEIVSKDLFMKATAYCPCFECCGKNEWDEAYGITASGYDIFSEEKNIIAADPKILPLGSIVDLYLINQFGTEEYVGQYFVEDTGGAIKGNRIDILYFTHEEAENFGIANVRLIIQN